ncbi:hypothetical protein LZ318_06115 [Saccharopolyspora indica]|uniref:hypothetical protein n=1 Tax=Saccharopolyspora indica TaxID=1229659 RepID=UPI0022EA65A7|nr:hypothetical protein [Saccharopolyspora indica]MDA3648839.1 hypothetical protein [Saccharopolyspora indica]
MRAEALRRIAIEAYLTERSGFYTAEAFGAIAAKLASLALAGLCAWIIAMMVEDGGSGVLVVGPLIALVLVIAVWIGLFLFNRPIIERLRPANRFHRLRRPRHADPDGRRPAALPERVLRSSPRGQADLFWRTGLFLLLGSPSAFLLGYCLLAYLDHLWSMWSNPLVDSWAWNAPEHFSGFGEWFFTDEWLTARVLVPSISFMFLTMGIALAVLAVPLLSRRGADAIDLAVTETGVITRGGLAIGWDEIAEVLVVRDARITSWSGPRELRAPGQPRSVLNPTYIAAHSRTRMALVLRDLPDVAARSLRADRTSTYGYALCDLWVHSAEQVSASLASLKAGAKRERVPVTELERVAAGSMPEGTPRWFSALFARR